jgi:cephalosporin hydroxylase
VRRLVRRALEVARSEPPTELARKLATVYPRQIGSYPWQLGRTMHARRDFVDAVRSAETGRDALDLISSFESAGIRVPLLQVRSEIERLLDVLERERPRAVVEIGTAHGGTLLLFTRVASADALLISIDLARGLFAGGYHVTRTLLYKAFAREQQTIELLRSGSHEPRTVNEVRNHLADREIDFLFIDGDHRYDAVARDFQTYSCLVRSGGLVAFHDIVPFPEQPERVGGVPRLWQELKKSYETEEFVESWSQCGSGIGLLLIP